VSSVSPLVFERLTIGSREHRDLMTRFFTDSYVEYVPEDTAWPTLSGEEQARLARLPFWQEAVSTENVTASTVSAAVALESDPGLRRAIELQGFEEQRHARLLRALTVRYDIPVRMPAPYEPRSLEHDFLYAGFGECFDSFFAFGLFAIAGRSGYFPSELVRVFEPVVQEEARHILFFVNWVKYRRSQLPWWRRPLFRLRCGWIILTQIASRMQTARTMGDASPSDAAPAVIADNLTLAAHQHVGESVDVRQLLSCSLSENERRLSRYDARLVRPRLVPTLARWAYALLGLGKGKARA
jgi:hypothetical protein